MDKNILITGAGGKVGKQLLKHFCQKGFNVFFTSRSDEKIKEIENSFKNAKGFKTDFFEENAVSKLVTTLQDQNIQINYLVNTARSLDTLAVEKNGEIKEECFLNEYKLDVFIPYQLSIALAKMSSLKKIINISSMYGMGSFNPHLYEPPFLPAIQYACAKAAVIQLTKCLAVCFADSNIQVNCITYGGIQGRVDDAFKERYARLCPQKRMMKEEEVVGAVDFLISDDSSYILGQNIIVDGGWTIW